jgi:hypothetical protein
LKNRSKKPFIGWASALLAGLPRVFEARWAGIVFCQKRPSFGCVLRKPAALLQAQLTCTPGQSRDAAMKFLHLDLQ